MVHAEPATVPIHRRPDGRVTLRAVLSESGRAWRRDLVFLTFLAALIEAPIVAIEVAVAHLTPTDLPGTDDGLDLGVSWGTPLVVLSAMLAHYFLAGVMESVEHAERHGHPRPSLRELTRGLPWARMLVADLVLRVAVVAGFALLVVPGVVIAVATVIVLPLLNLERRPLVPTVRRGVSLVRGHVRAALAVWFIVTFVLAALQEAAAEGFEAVFHSAVGEYLGHLVAEVTFLPLAALPVVMLCLDLAERRPLEPAGPG